MVDLDPRRRRAAAERALALHRQAAELHIQAKALEAQAARIEYAWNLEPGELPASVTKRTQS